MWEVYEFVCRWALIPVNRYHIRIGSCRLCIRVSIFGFYVLRSCEKWGYICRWMNCGQCARGLIRSRRYLARCVRFPSGIDMKLSGAPSEQSKGIVIGIYLRVYSCVGGSLLGHSREITGFCLKQLIDIILMPGFFCRYTIGWDTTSRRNSRQ